MKYIIGLVCSLALTLGAYGQTDVQVKHREVDQPGGVATHERVQKHTEMQGSPKQINRMQKDQERMEPKRDETRVEGNQRVEPKREETRVEGNTNVREHTRVEGQVNEQPRVTERTNVRVENRGGRFFFRDREIHERRDFDRNDVHFRIGYHPRVWWTTHYTNIVEINGCWYYEDGGNFYPAYGYDPDCNYPDQFVIFTFGG